MTTKLLWSPKCSAARTPAPVDVSRNDRRVAQNRTLRFRLSALDKDAAARAASSTSAADACPVFFDHEGQAIDVLCCDFGVRTPIPQPDQDSVELNVPRGAASLAFKNFKRELNHLLAFLRTSELPLLRRLPSGQTAALTLDSDAAVQQYSGTAGALGNKDCVGILQLLQQLTLNDNAVIAREHARPPVPAPLPIKIAFGALSWLLDALYSGRPIQRFWVHAWLSEAEHCMMQALETVARIPYFVALSVLHLYETLGWWDETARLKHLHFAEEYNESHHLAIMEALGGDRSWGDRFFAQHAAFAYYWLLVPLYMLDPSWVYKLGEIIELHASDTYSQFVEENSAVLKQLPPPLIAVQYYRGADLYLFDSFQTSPSSQLDKRRPPCHTLLDVFTNIRDDELEHVYTCQQCQHDAM